MGRFPTILTVAVAFAAAAILSSSAWAESGGVVAWGYNCCGQKNVPPDLTNVVAVSAAGNHSLALRDDGIVVAWGNNDQGQCNVPASLRAVGIAAGAYHSLALTDQGTVVAWGAFGAYLIPAFVPADLTNVIAIASGFAHGLALKADGTVVTWGSSNSNAPPGLSNVLAIAAGAGENLALKSDGTVVSWGRPGYPFYSVPPVLSNVVFISAHYYNFAAIKSDGSVVLWGNNNYGQTNLPAGLSNNISAVAPGVDCYVALKTDGTITSWGWNYFNQTNIPPFDERVIAISAGLAVIKPGLPEIVEQPGGQTVFTGHKATFSVKALGSSPLSYQWHFNNSVILGSTNRTIILDPVRPTNTGSYHLIVSNAFGAVTSAVAVLQAVESAPFISTQPRSRVGYVGQSASLSVLADGSTPLLYQWRFGGANIPGATNATLTLNPITTNQLGAYSVIVSNAFGTVQSADSELYLGSVFAWGRNVLGETNVPSDLEDVTALAGGAAHSLALRLDGTVIGWGSNGATETSPYSWLTNVAAIQAGDGYSMVLYSNGTARVYGNVTGLIGATNIAAISARYQIQALLTREGTLWQFGPSEPTNIVSVAAGYPHILAVGGEGSVWEYRTWNYGPPTRVPQFTTEKEFIDVAAGYYFSLALRGDGTITAWGRNDYGQTNVPAEATNIVSISAGRAHAMALRQDGRIFIWGDTNDGRMLIPPLLTNAVFIACGLEHNLALQGSGNLRWMRTPRSQILDAGRRTLLSGYAGGSAPIEFQWLRNGTNLLGETNAFFVIGDSQVDAASEYALVATNPLGSITSSVVTVTVNPTPPVFLTHPSNQNVRAGTNTILSTTVIGTQPLTFQWLFNGTELVGETNRTLNVTNARVDQTGEYSLFARNPLGVVTSSVAQVEFYPFEALPNPITTVGGGPAAWGDYDNDGRLDLLVACKGGNTPLLYRNEPSGEFTLVPVPFHGPPPESVAWGDFDNDGFLDIVLGYSWNGEVWHNNGDGTFTLTTAQLVASYANKVSLIDFDVDGRLDIVLGVLGSGLNRNVGSNQFVQIPTGERVLDYSSQAWGDFDRDGLPDFLTRGLDWVYQTILFKNQGDLTFRRENSGLPQGALGPVAWLDFDADGWLDTLMTGTTGTEAPNARIFRNNRNGSFSPIPSNIPLIALNAIAIADYNNDGIPDAYLTGNNGIINSSGLYQGEPGGTFQLASKPSWSNQFDTVAWGDYDRDGALDLAASSLPWGGPNRVTLYRNHLGSSNTPPSPPGGLLAQAAEQFIFFRWLPGTDLETPAAALTYDVRVGTSPGASDVLASDADVNGVRRVPRAGNAGPAPIRILQNLAFGRYYWAVQSVDSAFAGSPFTPEQTFIYAARTLPADNLTASEANLNGSFDTNAIPATGYFEWGTTTSYGSQTEPQGLTTNNSQGIFTATIGGLLPDTTYRYRFVLTNQAGVFVGGDANFITMDVPKISATDATNITSSSATLTTLVHPGRGTTWVRFEYGLSENYDNSTPLLNIGNGNSVVSVSQGVSGLIAGAAYHFRVVATNLGGVTHGPDQTFFTTTEPTATTLSASQMGTTTANVNARVNPNGFNTLVSFEYGLTPQYGTISSITNLGSSTNLIPVALELKNLRAGATYYYRVVASNSFGPSFGSSLSFRTHTNLSFIAQQAYLKASNTEGGGLVGDRFGFSVAIWGDTVVVGASGDRITDETGGEDSSATGVNGDQNNNDAPNSGAAYVFTREGTNWVQQAYLKASNTDAQDGFGFSVGISSNTIVVGAWREDSSASGVNGNQNDNAATNAGAVYVFVRDGINWVQQAYLKASNAQARDQFGSSVAISGETIIVGAPDEASTAMGVNGDQSDNSAGPAGAAYIFVRNGTNWSQQAYLKASNTGLSDYFGYSVSISANTVVAGAIGEGSRADGVNGDEGDNGATLSGAAYVFVRNGTNWSQQAYLKSSNPESFDIFGVSVSVSGDTVVVGANGEDSSAYGVNGNQNDNVARESGAAYVFSRNGSIWTQQAYLKGSTTDWSDSFGLSVSVSSETIIVGSRYDFSQSGAADVFVRSGTNWRHQAYLKASNAENNYSYGWNDEFGRSVAIFGETMIVGAHLESSSAKGVNGNQNDNSGYASGAAYIFTGVGPSSSPALNIAEVAGEIRIAWPFTSTGYVLDKTPAFPGSTQIWNQVVLPYQTNTTGVFITFPKPGDNQFYRLRKL